MRGTDEGVERWLVRGSVTNPLGRALGCLGDPGPRHGGVSAGRVGTRGRCHVHPADEGPRKEEGAIPTTRFWPRSFLGTRPCLHVGNDRALLRGGNAVFKRAARPFPCRGSTSTCRTWFDHLGCRSFSQGRLVPSMSPAKFGLSAWRGNHEHHVPELFFAYHPWPSSSFGVEVFRGEDILEIVFGTW